MIRELDIARSTDLLVRSAGQASVTDAIGTLVGQDPSAQRLNEVAQLLAQPGVLLPLVNGVLQDSDRLRAVDRNSYMLTGANDDGKDAETFHSVRLARREDEGGETAWDVQLHLWFPEQRRRLLRDIHTHAPNFGSVVLLGNFRDQVFVSASQGEDMLEYSDLSNNPSGEVRLRRLPERVVPAGQSHVMPHTVIHEATLSPREITATLAVRGRRNRNFGLVYTSRPREGAGPQQVEIDTGESLRRFRSAIMNT